MRRRNAVVPPQAAPAATHRTSRWRAPALAALAVLAVAGTASARRYHPLTFLVGDGPYYAETAVSMLYDHDLDLRNQLSGGLEVHGAQIALGPDGAWYPKHPILLPLVALPFLAALGLPGLLVLNLLVLAGVVAALAALAQRYAPPRASIAAALVLAGGTFLRAYAYNLSPDLLALLLFAAGLYALLGGRDGAAGLLFGGAALGKLLLIVLLPLGLGLALARRGPVGARRFALGAAGPILALMAFDAWLFGSPFVTAYDRNVRVVDGRVVTTSHRSLFDNPIPAGLAGEMFDPRHGLLPTAPALLLAAPGLILLARRNRGDAWFLAAIPAVLMVVLSAYRDWDASHYGNRFLMPVLACAAPPMALALETLRGAVGRALRRRRGLPAAGETA